MTWIVKGHVVHKDSHGFHSRIDEGGVQWMTAARGLIYNEYVEDTFKKPVAIWNSYNYGSTCLQKNKMIPPKYTGLQKADIPVITNDKVKIAIAGGP